MPITPGTEQRSNSSIRRVDMGDRGMAGIAESTNKHSKPGEMALNIPPNTSRSVFSDGSRTRTTTKPRVKKRIKEEAKVTEESADAILSYLKLHCMRTRNHDDAVDFLYGREQGM
jgi:hypothetical protein